ncbi:MAG: DUF1365 domain-containing protein [Alphaproteobacteria bacterium]|nr:DUF1365 domain-containing protein [Alphaproteobacteria bacterium]
MTGSSLYIGTVAHTRLRPVRHSFAYRVFSLYLDLDELPQLDRRLRLFAHNGRALLSIHDRDHGDGRTPIAEWVRTHLRHAGFAGDGRIFMQCYPRLWGYVFNPLTAYFCFRRDGTLEAILHEVHNTFGERHGYLIAVDGQNGPVIHQECEKSFYVSPFIGMAATYHFKVRIPDERYAFAIRETDGEGDLLYASVDGRRRTLTDGEIGWAIARHPLMTVKVIAGIHWEALRLWRKGLRVQARAKAPTTLVTYVGAKGRLSTADKISHAESSVLHGTG